MLALQWREPQGRSTIFSLQCVSFSWERLWGEVACHKAAFGRWRFRTVSDSLAEQMMESLSRWAFLSRPSLCKSSEFFGYPWSAVTNLSHVERGVSSKVFGHSFAAGGNHKEGRQFPAFSALLPAERALSEVACHKTAFGCWRFRTVSDSFGRANDGKLITYRVGLFFLALACASLQNSLDILGVLWPISAMWKEEFLESFWAFLCSRGKP